ncbi:collagen alpha-1(I) chain-like [Cervus canadensis]|uniref:collagen alpha-1(I) chain-like n=1 Tax=Cervus canadensis TaxID=1574408 RepID=UPI001C9E8CE9|nr:collagen alpha-1(I) chain-like [Cervus canadensis]
MGPRGGARSPGRPPFTSKARGGLLGEPSPQPRDHHLPPLPAHVGPASSLSTPGQLVGHPRPAPRGPSHVVLPAEKGSRKGEGPQVQGWGALGQVWAASGEAPFPARQPGHRGRQGNLARSQAEPPRRKEKGGPAGSACRTKPLAGLEDTPRSGAPGLCSHPPALSSAAPPPSPTGQTHRAFRSLARELSRGGEVPDILAATYVPASPLCDPLLGTERKPVLPEGDTVSSPTQLLVMGDALPKPHARVCSWGSQQEGLIQGGLRGGRVTESGPGPAPPPAAPRELGLGGQREQANLWPRASPGEEADPETRAGPSRRDTDLARPSGPRMELRGPCLPAAQVLCLSSHLRDPSAVSQLRISTPKTSHHVGDGGHLALISPSIAASEALETACPGGLSGPAATQSLSRGQSVPDPPRPIRGKTWLDSILPSRARIDTDLLRARTHVWQSACLPTQAANLPAGHARASVAHRYPNALLTPVHRARGHGECGEAADCARALTREPRASREAGAAGLREWGGRRGRGQDGRGGGSAPPSVAAAATAAPRPPPRPELEASPGGGLAPRTRSGGGPGPGGPARGRECRGRLPAPCGSSGPAEAASCPAPRPRVRRRSAASGPGRPGRCGPSTLRAQRIGCPGERRGPGPEGPPEPPPRPHFTDAATEAGEGPEPAGEAGPPNLAASPPGPGSGAERRDAEGGESPFLPPRGSAAGTSALPRDRRRQTPRSSLRAAPAGGAARRLGAFPPASLSASRCPGSGTPRPAPRPPDPGATSLKAAPNKSERAGRKGAGLSAPGSRNARNVRLRGRGAGGGRSGLIGWRPPPLERP